MHRIASAFQHDHISCFKAESEGICRHIRSGFVNNANHAKRNTFLTDQQLGIRIGALVGGLVIGCGVAAFSPSGKRFIGFCRESYDELRRVVWPTRRETVNTTGLVMAFVVAVAFYLFVVDKFVEWGLYDGLLRLSF